MARNTGQKAKLSKHLLEMKFMKSSRDRIQQEEDDEDCKIMFYNNISDELKSSSSKYISEPSWVICEGLRSGRRSFRGMNPVIEKLMALENCDISLIKKIKEEDVDVTIEEMIQCRRQQSTLVETIAKKFKKGKRDSDNNDDSDKNPIKKLKFLKPEED